MLPPSRRIYYTKNNRFGKSISPVKNRSLSEIDTKAASDYPCFEGQGF